MLLKLDAFEKAYFGGDALPILSMGYDKTGAIKNIYVIWEDSRVLFLVSYNKLLTTRQKGRVGATGWLSVQMALDDINYFGPVTFEVGGWMHQESDEKGLKKL